MAKKGRKKISGEKKVPRLKQIREKERRSRRAGWMTSLITVGIVILLSVFWYITSNNNGSWKFESKFDAFTCEIPDSWTDYGFEEAVQFTGAFDNSAHPHMFAPKSVSIGASQVDMEAPTLTVDPEFLEALEKNQGGKASPELNKQLTEQLQGQMGDQKIDNGQPEIDPNLTVLTAVVFTKDSTDEDIRRYINGIGGIDTPVEYYLTRLELEGTKIPGVEYGYYKLMGEGHPTGIIKTDEHTVIFDGIFAEGYEDDFKSIFESIKIP